MVKRYGYTWEYLTTTGGGYDADGNPIAATETWIPFKCDVQTSSGRYVSGVNGDKIAVSYTIFTNINIGIVKGGKLRKDGVEYTVLNFFNYKLNYEIWV